MPVPPKGKPTRLPVKPRALLRVEVDTVPNLVHDLNAKLDSSGNYDEAEVDRVVAVEMGARSPRSRLAAALEPVADRVLRATVLPAGAEKVGCRFAMGGWRAKEDSCPTLSRVISTGWPATAARTKHD